METAVQAEQEGEEGGGEGGYSLLTYATSVSNSARSEGVRGRRGEGGGGETSGGVNHCNDRCARKGYENSQVVAHTARVRADEMDRVFVLSRLFSLGVVISLIDVHAPVVSITSSGPARTLFAALFACIDLWGRHPSGCSSRRLPL